MFLPRLLLAFGAFALVSAFAAGNKTTLQGQEVALFGGQVTSYAELDGGNVSQVVVTLPLSVIENAPSATGEQAPLKAAAVVNFPAEVQTTTFLNNLTIFWESAGHEPAGRYDVPHWDFHFFAMAAAAAAAIDCSDLSQGDPVLVSAGWLPPVPPAAMAADFCVPLMGFHSLPASEFKAPGVMQDGPFDKVMINGFYGGNAIFVEPMITQALLLQRQSFSLPVPRPAKLGVKTLYPGSFNAIYNAENDSYSLVFSDFSEIE